MKFLVSAWTAASVLLVTAGCGTTAREPAPPVKVSGEIDASAPAVAQKKQRAVKRLLDAIHEGATDKGSLQLHAADIDFREAEGDFLGGHAWLARWNFDGPVTGDRVPVTLYFTDREFHYGDPSRHVESRRTYTVAERSKGYAIARAKEGP